MEKINISNLEKINGGSFFDGFCGTSYLATGGNIVRTVIKQGIKTGVKAAFGGPVGTALAVIDIACGAYTVAGMIKNW